MNDDELDRAVASLTDASPSPALRATIMRRIAEGAIPRRAPIRGWQMALAGATVILAAAAVWLAVRPGQSPQTTAIQRPLRAVTLPPSATVGTTPGEETRVVAQPPAGRVEHRRVTSQKASAGLRRPSLPEMTPPNAVVDEASDQAVSGVPPLIVPPIENPAPIVIPPVVVNPIEIPQIQILPVEDRLDKSSQPPATGPEKKQPGGASSAPTE
jgi:hypothetical protein